MGQIKSIIRATGPDRLPSGVGGLSRRPGFVRGGRPR
jgi:hypothetical protein